MSAPIYVTARVTYVDPNWVFGEYYAYWNGLPANMRSTTWQGGPYASRIDDDTVGLRQSDRILKDAAIEAFVADLQQFDELLTSLPPGQLIQVSIFETITVGALNAKFDAIEKWTIVNKSYPAGYGGRNYAKNIEVRWYTLRNYTLRGQAGSFT